MNLLSRFYYVLKEGSLQMFRSRGLSTAVIVIVAATLLQLSLFLGLSRILDRALSQAREKFEMALFLSPSADSSDLKRIEQNLSSDPRVASVKVVTKEEALEEFRKDPEIDQMLQALGENPLTDSLTIVLKKDVADKLDDLVAQLRQDSKIEEVDYGKNEWETVSNLSRLVRWVGLFLGGFVFLTALFIVASTFTLVLWARREDLVLMARMGAPTWLRWGPYLWEGTLQGFLGACAGIGLLEILHHLMGMFLQSFKGTDLFLEGSSMDWWSLYPTLLFLGVVLGGLGAFWALQKKWIKDLQ
jgi:cell division transport system permease protein